MLLLALSRQGKTQEFFDKFKAGLRTHIINAEIDLRLGLEHTSYMQKSLVFLEGRVSSGCCRKLLPTQGPDTPNLGRVQMAYPERG